MNEDYGYEIDYSAATDGAGTSIEEYVFADTEGNFYDVVHVVDPYGATYDSVTVVDAPDALADPSDEALVADSV